MATPKDLNLIGARYEIRPLFLVRSFINVHPFLVPLLHEAPAVIERYFGLGVPLSLEIFQPVDDPAHAELFLLIRWAGSPEDAHRRMDALDQDWWLDAAVAARGVMNIDLEPV